LNRPQKLREVFAELKETFGKQLPAGELIRLATALIEAYQTIDIEQYGDFGYATRDPFFIWDVDKAMRDGGWRILSFERKAGMELSDELPDNYWAVQTRIQRFIGQTEWPRIAMA
jgi:hypothetical protein